MSKQNLVGYFVVEACDDYEQPLFLMKGAKNQPAAGILTWASSTTLFASRSSARNAITRTEHWRLAFDKQEGGGDQVPIKKFCKIKPVYSE